MSEGRPGIPWAPPIRVAEVRGPVVSVGLCAIGALLGAGLLVGGAALMAPFFAPATDGINEPYGVVIALPLIVTGLLVLGFSVGPIARRVFRRE
ncbi:hypothetical protein [Cellulomonas humilata]|uniref:Uncharacterized protein n=1 Tax=Cellulomonas humilata TaxID=144055 RepID=A0ABU0EM01_9CELL|nr:hypothetical protein [Cellulomonas humilata]MDQ0375847.1 hypothetical protein [Cellulomonas humilata]